MAATEYDPGCFIVFRPPLHADKWPVPYFKDDQVGYYMYTTDVWTFDAARKKLGLSAKCLPHPDFKVYFRPRIAAETYTVDDIPNFTVRRAFEEYQNFEYSVDRPSDDAPVIIMLNTPNFDAKRATALFAACLYNVFFHDQLASKTY